VLVAVLGFFAFSAIASADPDSTDPNLQYDADGVPVSIMKPKAPRLSPAEIAALHKQQVQAAQDKDWLVRDYEKQLKMNSSADEQSSNLYYQLSANKDLAKLAGLPDIDDDGTTDTNVQPVHNTTAMRTHATGATAQPAGSALKPFITPMGAPAVVGLPNFYATLGGASGATPAKAPTSSRTSVIEDPTDIETPGMIAAQKNPNPDTLDLTLDVLPGESVDHARAHQDNDQLLTLPLPPGAEQLHRAQAVALNPDGLAPLPVTPTTPAQPKPMPVNDEDAPLPVSKTPVLSPVRAPIGNPYDILNR
jgi:hypothetical protein